MGEEEGSPEHGAMGCSRAGLQRCRSKGFSGGRLLPARSTAQGRLRRGEALTNALFCTWGFKQRTG